MKSKHSEYSIEKHFENGATSTRELFDYFLLNLEKADSRIEADPKKKYIGFKIQNRVVVAITPLQSKLKLQLYRVEPKDLDDNKKLVKYKTNSFEDFNKHISLFDMSTKQDADYGILLTKQVLDKFFS